MQDQPNTVGETEKDGNQVARPSESSSTSSTGPRKPEVPAVNKGNVNYRSRVVNKAIYFLRVVRRCCKELAATFRELATTFKECRAMLKEVALLLFVIGALSFVLLALFTNTTPMELLRFVPFLITLIWTALKH